MSRYLVDTFPYPYTQQDADWWIETGAKANNAVNKVIQYNGDFVGAVGITPQTGMKKHVIIIGIELRETKTALNMPKPA